MNSDYKVFAIFKLWNRERYMISYGLTLDEAEAMCTKHNRRWRLWVWVIRPKP